MKLGAKGAYYRKSGDLSSHSSRAGQVTDKPVDAESGYISGFQVKLVDEVGAGDAFAAGLISGLLDALPTSDAVLRACALGAIAVCGVGDYELAPTRKELEGFLAVQARKSIGLDGGSVGVSR